MVIAVGFRKSNSEGRVSFGGISKVKLESPCFFWWDFEIQLEISFVFFFSKIRFESLRTRSRSVLKSFVGTLINLKGRDTKKHYYRNHLSTSKLDYSK